MTEIPSQLQQPQFRFCRIPTGKKFPPLDKEWQNKNNFAYDDPALVNHLINGGNYGVCCGYGQLAVVDCDEQELAHAIEKLPRTFTTMSPNRKLPHYYFIIPELRKKIIFKTDEKHLGELQFQGQYVVGAGSLHPNGSRYAVIDDIPIAAITLKQLLGVTQDFKRTESAPKEPGVNKNYVNKGFPIERVVDLSKLTQRDENEFFGSHPAHGSTTGQNFWVNRRDNTWYCFRCCSGGDPLTLIAVLKGIIECHESKPGVFKHG